MSILNHIILQGALAAAENSANKNNELLSDGKKYAGIYNGFTRNLLIKVLEERKDENIVLSPLSILVLLVMVAESTKGVTREEIEKGIVRSHGF